MKKTFLICMWWLAHSSALAQTIDKAEYYFDTDPGIGDGVSVTIDVPATVVSDLSFDVDISSLSEGFHYLCFRVGDINGKWSPTEFRTIYKSAYLPPGGLLLDVVEAEYFIDTDPGIGEGTAIAITPANIVDPIAFEVPLDALSDGFHQLYLRVKDENGSWSATERRLFYRETLSSSSTIPEIVKIEYFVDDDPGFGNGTDVPVSSSTEITDHSFVLDVAGQSEGEHILFIRAMDANDKWSLVSTASFTVCNQPSPAAHEETGVSTGGFTANWSAIDNITEYRLDVSADDFTTFVTGFEDKLVNDHHATITGLQPGMEYKYRVRAVGTCASTSSNVITAVTPLTTPTINNPTLITSSSFQLSWAAVTNASAYRVDVSDDDFETFVPGFENNAVSVTSLSIDGLSAGVTYQYRIKAENGVAVSEYTQIKSVITVPAAPNLSETTDITASGFIANWTSVPGAEGYELDVSENNFATFVPGYNAAAVDGTSLSVTSLNANTEYRYRVRAVNTSGASANSSVAVVTTAEKAAQTITFLQISDRTMGDPPFSLEASASSGLEVSFSSTSTHVIVDGDLVTLIEPGSVIVNANQEGDETYLPADEVSQTFCIKPATPVLTLSNEHTESPVLTSSNPEGNQWYHDGILMEAETAQTLTIEEPGSYFVVTSIEGCDSESSDEVAIIVTSNEEQTVAKGVYPVPAVDYIFVLGLSANARITVSDLLGRVYSPAVSLVEEKYKVSLSGLPSGQLVLIARQGNHVQRFKVVKE